MKTKSFTLKIATLIGKITEFWRRRRLPSNLPEVHTKPLVLITGGSGGIGAALAHELAEADYNLLLIGKNEDRLRSVAARLKKIGSGEILSLAMDLANFELHDTIDDLLEAKGYHVEILVNNAGLGERNEFLETEWSELEHVLDVNIKVLTALTHRYLPKMTARGSGTLLNMASLGGVTPGPYNSIYFSTKAYVVNFTESLANEVRGKGVYIGAILAGPTKTAFHHKIDGQNSLYNYILWHLKPRFVARSVHRGMLTRIWTIITPGFIYSLAALFLRVIPGSLMAPLMGFLYKKRSF
ncbi:SDR family NAD(P)-dependent oxidoreductase [Hyphomicrobiales bacterium 4NK60-0047b]